MKSYEKIIVDIGSSTTKIYGIKQNQINLIKTISICLKEYKEINLNITDYHINQITDSLKEIKKEIPNTKICLFATAIFRKLKSNRQKEIINYIFDKTGLYLNIISKELETHYLEAALTEKFNLNNLILLINIGGGSTELVIKKGKKTLKRISLDIGVRQLIEKFPGINNPYSTHKINEVTDYINRLLPNTQLKPKYAFYNGGELTYMKLAKYPLIKNSLFKDEKHPFIIQSNKFWEHNEKIFYNYSIKELENKYPTDPNWTHGARACSAIAETITKKYNIDFIIPSDTNTVDGIVNHEFRYVTLSGSFRKHLDYIVKIKYKLENLGAIILSPRFCSPKNPGEEFVVFDGEEGMSPLDLENYHLSSIEKSDVLVICNKDGYVGSSALIEIGYAQQLNKRIIFTEYPEEFMLRTLPAEFGL